MRPHRSRLALLGPLCAAELLSACSGGGPTPTPSQTASATAGATPTGAGSVAPPSPTPIPTPRGLPGCPSTPAAASSLPVIWRGGGADDLATGPDGALWVGNAATQVVRLQAGAITRTLRFSAPEGIVPLPGGDVVIAEQGRQRILDVHPDGSQTVLLTLPSAGGQLGVDGIGWDPRTNAVLVPDSPHGVLYSVPVDQPGHVTTLATGLPRVVGVVSGPNGTGLFLAAEANAPQGLLHLSGSGPATPLGNLAQLDDVVFDRGLLYATDLRNLSVHAIDPATGTQRTVATGFGEPQGLTVLPDGDLAVADESRGLVQRLTPCA